MFGGLALEASTDGGPTIADTFEVRIGIPNAYPEILPVVRETGGKVDRSWGHVNPDGTLCLGVPIEVRRIFSEQPSLLGFVNRLVIPYLYSYGHWRDHGRHPFGEAEHGDAGIVRYYVDALDLRNEVSVLAVLSYLLRYGYRGHLPCPCGSGVRTRRCHADALRQLSEHHTGRTLRIEFEAVLRFCSTSKAEIPRSLKRELIYVLRQTQPPASFVPT